MEWRSNIGWVGSNCDELADWLLGCDVSAIDDKIMVMDLPLSTLEVIIPLDVHLLDVTSFEGSMCVQLSSLS